MMPGSMEWWQSGNYCQLWSLIRNYYTFMADSNLIYQVPESSPSWCKHTAFFFLLFLLVMTAYTCIWLQDAWCFQINNGSPKARFWLSNAKELVSEGMGMGFHVDSATVEFCSQFTTEIEQKALPHQGAYWMLPQHCGLSSAENIRGPQHFYAMHRFASGTWETLILMVTLGTGFHPVSGLRTVPGFLIMLFSIQYTEGECKHPWNDVLSLSKWK